MLNLAFIFHMHQPYYKNLLTKVSEVPWVRLHGSKDYLDMVLILKNYPKIHQTFNLVPCLIEQTEDYLSGNIKDKFLELTRKPVAELTTEEKSFIINNFFSINPDKVISVHPRYYELYLKKQTGKVFSPQDFLDLQVWFNLSWIDPFFRSTIAELKRIEGKGRFFTEVEKGIVLDKQLEILKDIIPTYQEFIKNQQIEVTMSPYYHPILPLLADTNIAKEANKKTVLPKIKFSFIQDALAQIESASKFYQERFGDKLKGMWPSEEAVSEHILPLFIKSGLNWIVADEGVLFKSLKARKRNTRLLYQPHLLKRKDGNLNIIFRDRNLSDLLGFVYHSWKAEDAVKDFIAHLEKINSSFKGEDILVTIAMDGENAWEYYKNDGHDFLELLYQRLSDSENIKTMTISEYLKDHPAKHQIQRLAAGSWIYTEFGKWIGNPHKVKAWEWLALARQELEKSINSGADIDLSLALKQMYILEGSDWFWWFGEDYPGYFDALFRMHLTNLYTLLKIDIPEYLNKPLTP
ncbi:MAG: glycoside hydrolase family 57 protein [Candidatus Omnitrophota bacterium]